MKTIGIDLLGSDAGYGIFPEACLTVLNNNQDIQLVCYGDKEACDKMPKNDRIRYEECSEVVKMEDSILSVRRKKDSTLMRMMKDLNDNKLDGVLSAGSTAGIVLSAHFNCKLVEGVRHSFLISPLPSAKDKPVYLADMGANAECTAEDLYSFALLANEYVKKTGNSQPQIGLLNIGAEETKGDHIHREAYELLKKDDSLSFKGNCEGRDVLSGDYDIVVSDGFSGNVLLKSMEGTASFIMSLLKESFTSSLLSKIGALLLKKKLYALKEKVDYKSYGGACLLGFERPIIKAHGSSDTKAVISALSLLIRLLQSQESVL